MNIHCKPKSFFKVCETEVYFESCCLTRPMEQIVWTICRENYMDIVLSYYQSVQILVFQDNLFSKNEINK